MSSWLGKQRIDLEACGSTNDEAARFARAGASHGTIVIAQTQSSGRGRDGRVWQSPSGNLYLSAIVKPPISLELVPPLTLAIGIGVCDAVRLCGAPGQLKWPNDILVGGKKLAGVLVEAQSQGNRLETVIVGIGLNIRRVPVEVEGLATSLDQEQGSDEPAIDRELVIERVCTQVERWIDRYVAIGLPSIVEAWQSRMVAGLRVRVSSQPHASQTPMIDATSGFVTGEVAGLDVDGALLVRGGDGAVTRVRSGDVEVIRAAC